MESGTLSMATETPDCQFSMSTRCGSFLPVIVVTSNIDHLDGAGGAAPPSAAAAASFLAGSMAGAAAVG